jgi:HlyD family secretion protein
MAPVVSPPSRPAPPEPAEPRRKRWWLWFAILVVLLFAAWGVVHAMRSRPSVSEGQNVRTATVIRGEFIRTLRVTGTTEAMQSYVVAAPTLTGGGLGSLIITRLAPAGSKVHKGDLLVEFDRQNEIKNALDKQAEYNDLVEQIKKKQAEQAIARATDDTGLHQAEDAMKSAELEVRRNEVLSKIDAEKNLANLEEAKANLQQLQETYQLKRQAEAADMKVLEIQRDRAQVAMEHSQNNAAKMEIRSPLEGVVVLNTTWKGNQMGEVQEGDEVRPGVPFMQVMNPGQMQVRARVNQSDVPWLDVGQTVQIRLDAYPGMSLPGKLQRLAAIGVTSGMSSKVRTFTALFNIEGSDAHLMPDLSAAIDIVLQRQGDSLIVPRDALYLDAGGAFVWVKRGQSFEREEVKLGPVADDEAVVTSGLQAGDVVLRNPRNSQRAESKS